MTEQPPRSTREKVEHQYGLGSEASATGERFAVVSIETICRKALLDILEYAPEGPELQQGLLRHREALLWFTHAVLVNSSDNSTADGKLVESEVIR